MQLESLSIFKEVADMESFAKVADRRQVNPSSISRAIQSLEEEVGFQLFIRTTRRLQLTEAGAVYLQNLTLPLEQLHLAQQAALDTKERVTGTLRVTLPLDFADTKVIPLIPEFKARYPQLKTEWVVTDECLDLEQAKIDVAIRLGKVEEPNWVARKLMDIRFTLCATPHFIEQHPIEKIEDLADCSTMSFLPLLSQQWAFFNGDATQSCANVYLQNNTLVTTARSVKQLCLLDHGVALLPDWIVETEIARGELVALFDQYHIGLPKVSAGVAWCVYPSRTYVPAKARVMIDFLVEHLVSSE